MTLKDITHSAIAALLLTLATLSAAIAQTDTLTASVDRQTIALGESVRLNIRYNGSSDRSVNTDVLGADFDILSRNQSSSTQVSFGSSNNFSSTVQWDLYLRPKREGSVTIPAFVIEGVSSEPITLAVSPAATPAQTGSNTAQPIYLETSINNAKPFEQEQTLLTIRLVSAYNIVDQDFDQQDPIIPDAKVERVYIGQYQKMIDGRQKVILEKVYAIFPQSAGALTIPAVPHAVIYQEASRSRRLSLFNTGNRIRKDFQSDVLTLHVKPKDNTQSPWLPAQSLELRQHWSSSPKSFVVGEPITRDITIEATGLLGSQLPEIIIPATANLKLYPDQPQLDNQLSNTGVIGSRALSTAIVASKPGRYSLPEIKVLWWDTNSKKTRYATLPAEEIIVTHADGEFIEPTVDATLADDNIQNSGSESNGGNIGDNTSSALAPMTIGGKANYYWIATALFFALTTLLFATLWLRLRRQTQAANNTSSKNIGIAPATNPKQALKELRRHCDSGLLSGVRTALLNWGEMHYGGIQTLQDLSSRVQIDTGNSTLPMLIQQLDASLYSASKASINTADIYVQVKSITTAPKKNAESKSALAPLYGPK